MGTCLRSFLSCIRHKFRRFLNYMVASCDPDLLKVSGFLTGTLLILISLIWLLIWDVCKTDTLIKELCDDYTIGKAAGSWCYELCVVKSLNFKGGCVEHSDSIVTFRYKGSIVRIPLPTSEKYSTSVHDVHYWVPNLEEPIAHKDFDVRLRELLHSKLGPSTDLSEVLEKVYSFADFSHNGEISYGEANSIWKLLNNHEFFLIFLFQDNQVFPRLNGTCGHLYAYEYVGRKFLFNAEKKTFLNHFFSNTYRWTLPDWDKRANVAVGLLEYGTTTSEIYNAKFLMCDLMATRFGHSDLFEPKLLSYDHILSEYSLGQLLKDKKCRVDEDCTFQHHCQSSCDTSVGLCSPNLTRPSMVAICKLVRDYLAFDSPEPIREALDSLLNQCTRVSEQLKAEKESKLHYYSVRYNIIISSIQELLWDQIKNKPASWLKPKTKRIVKAH